jgi:hypothetical protein
MEGATTMNPPLGMQVSSRRAVLLAGLSAGLGFGRPRGSAAQSATPAAASLPPPVARFVAAMDAADPDQLADSYAPNLLAKWVANWFWRR